MEVGEGTRETHAGSAPFAISFMTANYVARELGYGAADQWGPFDEATNAAFEPLETFAAHFEELVVSIASLGFDAIDLWFGHLNWRWATNEHVTIARDVLGRTGVRVASLAGSIGSTPADVEAACRLANELGVDLIAGPGDVVRDRRAEVTAVLDAHGLRFGLENHPEKTPDEVLAAIGDDANVLGAAVDTGWWATQGYDPVAAIHELSDRLFHVHLKDVEEPGTHVTCMHGAGCARISDCVDALLALGYTGPVSIEHHSFTGDPGPECARALARIDAQLSAATAPRDA